MLSMLLMLALVSCFSDGGETGTGDVSKREESTTASAVVDESDSEKEPTKETQEPMSEEALQGSHQSASQSTSQTGSEDEDPSEESSEKESEGDEIEENSTTEGSLTTSKPEGGASTEGGKTPSGPIALPKDEF